MDHIEGFEQILKDQKEELKKRHQEFLEEMRAVVNVEEIHKDFSNLKKLDEIYEQLKRLTADSVKTGELHRKPQETHLNGGYTSRPTEWTNRPAPEKLSTTKPSPVSNPQTIVTPKLTMQGTIEKSEKEPDKRGGFLRRLFGK